MTDTEALEIVLATIGGTTGSVSLVSKKGRVLLALPKNREAALVALQLYQPQRVAAKGFIKVLELAVRIGIHPVILRKLTTGNGQTPLDTAFPNVIPGSLGIMLGSPEHQVRRAIASYETENGVEVAKIAFGQGGHQVISGEAAALASLPSGISGIPEVLGTQYGDGISMMRMPYFQGAVLDAKDSADAIALLDSWTSSEPPVTIQELPEWPTIEHTLSSENGRNALESLANLKLVPTIRHGDFARWNLLRTSDGKLTALDWEWGVARGMPGIDLVHFFAQDARLVRKLSPSAVVSSVLKSLEDPHCAEYLERTGWGGEARLALLVSLAYTFGTGQQANGEILDAALWGKAESRGAR